MVGRRLRSTNIRRGMPLSNLRLWLDGSARRQREIETCPPQYADTECRVFEYCSLQGSVLVFHRHLLTPTTDEGVGHDRDDWDGLWP